MANTSILQLPVATQLSGAEWIWIVQNGVDKRVQLFEISSVAGGMPAAAILQASQTMSAPALVNVSGTFQVSYANAATGVPANGYITSNVLSGGLVLVIFNGLISGFVGPLSGPVFLSATTPGGVSETPPALGSGYYAQQVGIAISASAIAFNTGPMNGPL